MKLTNSKNKAHLQIQKPQKTHKTQQFKRTLFNFKDTWEKISDFSTFLKSHYAHSGQIVTNIFIYDPIQRYFVFTKDKIFIITWLGFAIFGYYITFDYSYQKGE